MAPRKVLHALTAAGSLAIALAPHVAFPCSAEYCHPVRRLGLPATVAAPAIIFTPGRVPNSLDLGAALSEYDVRLYGVDGGEVPYTASTDPRVVGYVLIPANGWTQGEQYELRYVEPCTLTIGAAPVEESRAFTPAAPAPLPVRIGTASLASLTVRDVPTGQPACEPGPLQRMAVATFAVRLGEETAPFWSVIELGISTGGSAFEWGLSNRRWFNGVWEVDRHFSCPETQEPVRQSVQFAIHVAGADHVIEPAAVEFEVWCDPQGQTTDVDGGAGSPAPPAIGPAVCGATASDAASSAWLLAIGIIASLVVRSRKTRRD
jgi:hypothetical protein